MGLPGGLELRQIRSTIMHAQWVNAKIECGEPKRSDYVECVVKDVNVTVVRVRLFF
jgi:hypothetical protein